MSEARRFVVKVGSTLVTNRGAGLDASAIARWAGQVAKLRQAGREILLVSSGAIAEGMQRLGWTRRPSAMHELQAAAAVGQMGLAQAYESCFREHGLRTAQVLLTHADLADRQRYLNARSTLLTLLGLGIIPVINENDTVVTEEIRFGDNDTLAALVTNLVEADCLVILTDQQGLFTADPRVDPGASLIRQAQAGEARLEALAGGTGSAIAKGGMLTKVLAPAQRARGANGDRPGSEPDVLPSRRRREAIGPCRPQTTPRCAQAVAASCPGRRTPRLDAGPEGAGLRRQKPAAGRGQEVEGEFERGAVVHASPRCRDRARTGQLQRAGVPPHSRARVERDRSHPRLHRRARVDPPR
jgi:glutamate 5-kinase